MFDGRPADLHRVRFFDQPSSGPINDLFMLPTAYQAILTGATPGFEGTVGAGR